MKKIFLILATILAVFSSCQKEKCKEQQQTDLKNEFERFQRETSNSNLTVTQIEALARRHEERNKQILAECN